MKYCSECGFEVFFKIFVGDSCECYVCDSCGFIYYLNFWIIVGILLVYEDKILLCKCVIEFCRGYWILFVGFMENGEIIV